MCDGPRASSARGRRGGRFVVVALGILVLPPVAPAAEPPFGDLPPGIAKARPSASVPADLPGSRVDPCAVFAGTEVFVPLRGGALAGVDAGALTGADGGPCARPPAAAHPTTATGGGLPFGEAGE
jgi:hypothetical protein